MGAAEPLPQAGEGSLETGGRLAAIMLHEVPRRCRLPPPVFSQQFDRQATACESLGSPFTARLCRVLAQRLDTGNALRPPHPRMAGRSLRRQSSRCAPAGRSTRWRGRGWEPSARAVYPPADVSEHTLWVAIIDALSRHDRSSSPSGSSSAPQTNEVARSALHPRRHAARSPTRHGLPLEHLRDRRQRRAQSRLRPISLRAGGGQALGTGRCAAHHRLRLARQPRRRSMRRSTSSAGTAAISGRSRPANSRATARGCSPTSGPTRPSGCTASRRRWRCAAAAGRRVEEADAADWLRTELGHAAAARRHPRRLSTPSSGNICPKRPRGRHRGAAGAARRRGHDAAAARPARRSKPTRRRRGALAST